MWCLVTGQYVVWNLRCCKLGTVYALRSLELLSWHWQRHYLGLEVIDPVSTGA